MSYAGFHRVRTSTVHQVASNRIESYRIESIHERAVFKRKYTFGKGGGGLSNAAHIWSHLLSIDHLLSPFLCKSGELGELVFNLKVSIGRGGKRLVRWVAV